MRINIVIGPYLPFPPVLGGAVEKAYWSLAGAMRAAGHDVTILSRRHADFPHEESVGGIKIIRIASFTRRASLLMNLFLGLLYSARAARTLPCGDVTMTNEFFLPLLLPRRKAGKIYVQVGRFPKGQMGLYFRADRLQAVSRAVAAAIAQQTPWIAPKVKVVGYALPDIYFRDNRQEARPRVVLYVGRIAKEKGIELLIHAFRLLWEQQKVDTAQWKLRIVGPYRISQGGDGEDYRRSLEALAEPLGTYCEFVEPIFDQTALAKQYRQASVFVYPSLADHGEALGLAPLEAMASGCAAIVSDLRCFDDFIDENATGLRFDHRGPDAIEQLANRLDRVMSNPALLASLAAKGGEAARKYSAESIARMTIDDFRSLVAA